MSNIVKDINGKEKGKWRYCTGFILFFIAVILEILARNVSGFSEMYAKQIYPIFVFLIGGFSGFFPFSLFELIICLLVFCIVIFIVFAARTLIRQSGKIYFFVNIGRIVLIAGLLSFLYVSMCGVNYYRTSFSKEQGMIVTYDYSVEELTELCRELQTKLNEYSYQMETTESGTTIVPNHAADIAREAMNNLSFKYESLNGFYPKPKFLLNSRVLSLQNITGIYSPFTIEANVNSDMVSYNILFTACHELSHLRGFMREDEANYIAYLACINSDNVACRYSGYAVAFIECGNALYKNGGREAYFDIFDGLADVVKADFAANDLYWEEFDTPVATAAQNINNNYLKANGQSDGIKSYGRMVDLMLAQRRAEIN